MEPNKSILLIEDSPTQAIRLCHLLQCLGYEVHVANDGRIGWNQACDEHPTLILLDINLPTMNGLQVLARLKCNRTTADIPVVMLSSSDSVFYVEQALELGAQDYLFKGDCMRWDAATFIGSALDQVLCQVNIA